MRATEPLAYNSAETPTMAHKLNSAKLRTLTKPGVYGDGSGLYLQVRHASRRTWIYRFTLRGRARWMGLGSVADVTLAEARDAAAQAHKLVKSGLDPIEARDAGEATAVPRTFRSAAALYVAAHEAAWRSVKHRQQWDCSLATHVFPTIGDRSVATLETDHVLQVLEPIWRAKAVTAARLRGRIEAVLDYAKTRGWRTGDNPARWRGHLDNVLPSLDKFAKVEHHAALPWREVHAFVVALDAHETVAARALRFCILTAARAGEVLGATWGEINLDSPDGPLWIVPPSRMKAGREHRVPLPLTAVATLRHVAPLRAHHSPDALVFPGQKPGKPLPNTATMTLLRRMGRGDLTTHGFRSTFRDWVAESTNHQRELAEAALAHIVGNKTEAAYQRGDLLEKRRRLMNEWAAFCADPAPAARIVQLRPPATG
jgi:integrase